MTATSSLALSVGLIEVAEREVYAALDWLIEQQTRIEAALAQSTSPTAPWCFTTYHRATWRPLLRAGQARLQPGSSARPSADRIRIDVRTGRTPVPSRCSRQHQRPADDPRADRQDQTPFKLSHVRWSATAVCHVGAISEELRQPARLDQLPQAPQIAALASDTAIAALPVRRARSAEITSPDFPGEPLVACRNPRWPRSGGSARSFCRQRTSLTRLAHAVRASPQSMMPE